MIAGKLIADYENGEGKLTVSKQFKEQDALLRSDILRDWLHDVENAYNEAVADLRRKSTSPIEAGITREQAAQRLIDVGISGVEARQLFAALNNSDCAHDSQHDLPCPFCGSDSLTSSFEGGFYHIGCGNCLAAGPLSRKSENKAVKKWNKRAGGYSGLARE